MTRAAWDHGSHKDAVDFILAGHVVGEERAFLTAWNAGDLSGFPDFDAWLDARDAATAVPAEVIGRTQLERVDVPEPGDTL